MPFSRNDNKNQLIQIFMNHCATLIQANFKGYKQRKYYRRFLPIYRRFKQLLHSHFIGWKIRKILKLSIIKNKIKQIRNHQNQQKNLQLRIAKRDFTDQILRLFKNGAWIYYFLKQAKIALNPKNFSFKNIKNADIQKKTNLKEALKLISEKICSEKRQKSLKKLQENYKKQKTQTDCIKNKNNLKQQAQLRNIDTKKVKQRKYQNPQINHLKNLRTQKEKLKCLDIQIAIEPELIQLNQTVCETPQNDRPFIKQFCFNATNKYNIKSGKLSQKEIYDQHSQFKMINMLNSVQRKGGLHMTLSKKYPIQIVSQVNQINSQVLDEFKKKKFQNSNQNYQNKQKEILQKSHDLKQKTALNLQGEQILNRTLKIKRDQFERKKRQHFIKVKQLKNHF